MEALVLLFLIPLHLARNSEIIRHISSKFSQILVFLKQTVCHCRAASSSQQQQHTICTKKGRRRSVTAGTVFCRLPFVSCYQQGCVPKSQKRSIVEGSAKAKKVQKNTVAQFKTLLFWLHILETSRKKTKMHFYVSKYQKEIHC